MKKPATKEAGSPTEWDSPLKSKISIISIWKWSELWEIDLIKIGESTQGTDLLGDDIIRKAAHIIYS